MTLTAAEFEARWAGPLVRLSSPCPALPEACLEWLSGAGLPARVRVISWVLAGIYDESVKQGARRRRIPGWAWPIGHEWRRDTEVAITFGRLAKPLTRLSEEDLGASSLSREWWPYWVIGEETFPGGSAQLVVHESTGSVHRVDVELPEPVALVSTSVTRLAELFTLFASWSARHSTPEAASGAANVAELAKALMDVDPEAMRQRSWVVPLDSPRHAINLSAG